MNKNNRDLFEDGPEDINDYPHEVRISAYKAISKAQIEAKISPRTVKPQKTFVCRLPSCAVPPNFRIEDLRPRDKNQPC